MSKMDPAGLLPGPEIDSRTATRPLRDMVSERRMHFGDHILWQLRGRHPEDLCVLLGGLGLGGRGWVISACLSVKVHHYVSNLSYLCYVIYPCLYVCMYVSQVSKKQHFNIVSLH